ncbi:tautomerase family protein [Franconibacter pulveris]|uniref:tautomerase family protein n=1 Tax=Franconibacter pulveris TaxID=435910 RepID=UPI000496CB08|nr:tautomerase family protein [Franconibacter pulveris]HBI10865.1 tautomerase family protein [Franconibacter pulveris]
MPLTRIVLQEGRSEQALRTLSTLLHDTLVAEFAVPPDDCFQVIETLPAGRLIYDRHYLTGTRSDNFILFLITAGKPRSREQKQNLYRALAARLHEALGIHPDDVMIVIQFTTADDWSFGGGRMFTPEAL